MCSGQLPFKFPLFSLFLASYFGPGASASLLALRLIPELAGRKVWEEQEQRGGCFIGCRTKEVRKICV